jgi:hypothetical protein
LVFPAFIKSASNAQSLHLWSREKFIQRTNKLEKVNLQRSHIVTILESFGFAAVSRNVTSALRNASISLEMDTDRAMRRSVTSETSRHVMGLLVQDELIELAQEEEMGDEKEESNIDEHMAKKWRKYGL